MYGKEDVMRLEIKTPDELRQVLSEGEDRYGKKIEVADFERKSVKTFNMLWEESQKQVDFRYYNMDGRKRIVVARFSVGVLIRVPSAGCEFREVAREFPWKKLDNNQPFMFVEEKETTITETLLRREDHKQALVRGFREELEMNVDPLQLDIYADVSNWQRESKTPPLRESSVYFGLLSQSQIVKAYLKLDALPWSETIKKVNDDGTIKHVRRFPITLAPSSDGPG